MSSSEAENLSSSSSGPIQSAQPRNDQSNAEEESLESSSEDPNDESSDEDTTTSLTQTQNSKEKTSNQSEDDAQSSAVEVDPDGPDVNNDDNDDDNVQATSTPKRPNKYNGPASTWRNWTAAERELATSLDQLTAKDLSVHLYNAFQLKKRGEAFKRQRGCAGVAAFGERDDSSTWVPPRLWTAWPLPPGEVPREDRRKCWGESESMFGGEARRRRLPSETLKELLVAQVLRCARSRFEERESEEPEEEDPGAEIPKAGMINVKRNSSATESIRAPSEGLSDQESLKTRKTKKRGDLLARKPARAPIEGVSDQESAEARTPKKRGDPLPREPARAPSEVPSDQESPELKPVVLADDDLATDILRPTVQDVLTKLDRLLMGLHCARSSYVKTSNSTSGCQKHENPSQSKSKKRRRSPFIHETDAAVTSDVSMESKSEHKPASKTKPSSKSRAKRPEYFSQKPRNESTRNSKANLGLRDWSDVLGMASMTGWDGEVVERAAARCSSLFGEGIMFRTLEAGSTGIVERSYLPDISEPEVVSRDEESGKKRKIAGIGKQGKMFGGVHVDGFLQPIKGKKSWKYPNNRSTQRGVSRKSRG